MLNKGLSFRLPQPRNAGKALKSFKNGIDEYVKCLSKKFKLPETVFDNWRVHVIQCIKIKLETISNYSEKFLDTEKAFVELKKLQDKFVFIPTDKSGNNVSIVCTNFYLECIQNELVKSFTIVEDNADEIISKQKCKLKGFKILLDENCSDLASFYASCKQHKSPIKFRYITSTTNAVSKPLARVMKACFSSIQKEVIRDCNCKDYNRKDNAKTCWIINNNLSVRKSIFKCNRSISKADSICSYDFDTLYTSIPHDKLKYVISRIVDSSFESAGKQFIRVTAKNNGVFSDSDRKYKGTYIFDKNSIKDMFKYMIDNCFIVFKGKVYRQSIGIPMGIDPAPFIANLFLHHYENNYMYSLINSGDLHKAVKLSNFFRYLDDLLGLNDKGIFDQVAGTIYPCELALSRTDIGGKQADYLDMNISFDNKGFFHSKLYDKRDYFGFTVINFPCMAHSNIPSTPSYGIYLSQILRICRICTDSADFCTAIYKLSQDFLNKGFNKLKLAKKYNRFIDNYEKEWCKFGHLPVLPSCLHD